MTMYKPDRAKVTQGIDERALQQVSDYAASFRQSVDDFIRSSRIEKLPDVGDLAVKNAIDGIAFATHKLLENSAYLDDVNAAAAPHKQQLAALHERLQQTQKALADARAARRSALADGTAAGMSSGEVAALVNDSELLADLIEDAKVKLKEYPIDEIQRQIGIAQTELKAAQNALALAYYKHLASALEGELLRCFNTLTKFTPTELITFEYPMRLVIEGRPASLGWTEWKKAHNKPGL
ncbi:hypothetical protein ACFA67_004552 [Salmonella enterica]